LRLPVARRSTPHLFPIRFVGFPKWFRPARRRYRIAGGAEADPVRFRAALVKARFYTQWQKSYGAEAWAQLEKYTGRLT
jgi:hypothetical protein